MAGFWGNGAVMHGPRPFGIDELAPQWAEDSAYSTFSFTTNPLAIARSRTKDIYRWRVMPDFAARASRRFTSLAVRRTVTGLAGSRVGGMACEHVSPVKIRQALWGATSFRLRENYASNTTLLMSDLEAPQKAHEDLPLPDLSTEVREALFESAQRNGRTVHEEAEHIIKSHLAASIEDED